MRLIDGDALLKEIPVTHVDIFENCRNCSLLDEFQVRAIINTQPTIDAVPVVHGQKTYTSQEVAEILNDLFGDGCPCNYNGIDEWLPYVCDICQSGSCCTPYADCWEQYLKHRDKRPKEVTP